jgi:hypothetical protein
MALILDHINGVPDDNRLTNLRIVCPNCAATFDTHCGRHNRQPARGSGVCAMRCEFHTPVPQPAALLPSVRDAARQPAPKRLSSRRVERPPLTQLLAEIEATSVVAVGRRYGVSDNAVRKWIRAYEAEGPSAQRR